MSRRRLRSGSICPQDRRELFDPFTFGRLESPLDDFDDRLIT